MPKVSNFMDEPNQTYTECLLDSGGIVQYDLGASVSFCEEQGFVADNRLYEYLGEGVVYSVNGVLQNGKIKNRYWRKR